MKPMYVPFMAAGVLLSALIWFFLPGNRSNRGKLCLLGSVLGVVLGLCLSKLVYFLVRLDFMLAEGESLFSVEDPSSFSYYGGVLGVILAVTAAARLLKMKPVAVLNDFAPAGIVMASLARFAEYWLEGVGLGDYLDEGGAFCFFPAAVPFTGYDWTEWYVAVFFLEALVTLVVAVISLFALREDRFVRSLFYLCLPQLLLETLRSESISWLFVRVEQLFCMVVVLAVLLLYGMKSPGKKGRWLPGILALICAGVFVLVEFVKEGKIGFLTWMNVPACFFVSAVGLCVLAYAEITGWRRWRK